MHRRFAVVTALLAGAFAAIAALPLVSACQPKKQSRRAPFGGRD